MKCTQCNRTLRSSARLRGGLCTKCVHDSPRRDVEIDDEAILKVIMSQWQDGMSPTEMAQKHRITIPALQRTIAKHSRPHFLTFLGVPQ